MDVLATVKPYDLIAILTAAKIWYLANEKNPALEADFKRMADEADRIRHQINLVNWDEDARLYIDEMPF